MITTSYCLSPSMSIATPQSTSPESWLTNMMKESRNAFLDENERKKQKTMIGDEKMSVSTALEKHEVHHHQFRDENISIYEIFLKNDMSSTSSASVASAAAAVVAAPVSNLQFVSQQRSIISPMIPKTSKHQQLTQVIPFYGSLFFLSIYLFLADNFPTFALGFLSISSQLISSSEITLACYTIEQLIFHILKYLS
ncbi:uncharacterized protein LOC106641054 [Copidosoma floridanum]|uniref:uncharacterized protein LOC106641054 n=1 Tax=Copidosoma floridanum TaxID=29053 RepID=UPI0006C94E6B|nr:uncharacterized protein LOC106641054 [Copidosoma floridanum]